MPGHLGGDQNGDGLIDYANSAAQLREEEEKRGGFEVEFTVRRDLCRQDATYSWESAAGTITELGRSGCEVSQRFQKEGEYQVRLTVRRAGRLEAFDREVRVQDWLVVSIGDSVASGEGNPDRPGKLLPGKRFRAKWESARCHRSSKAGPAQAALEMERSSLKTTVTFVHLACSGAQIGKGLLRGYKGIDANQFSEPPLLTPQVDELEEIARERDIDAVLLSVGANDVFFGPIVGFCLKKMKCMKKRFSPPLDKPEPPLAPAPLEDIVPQALSRLSVGYERLATRLATGREGKQIVAPQHVVIVDYFDPTRDSAGKFCKRIGFPVFHLGQIDAEEAEWAATKLLEPLNTVLHKAAAKAKWKEVRGVAGAFREHGYCAKDSWIVHINKSVRTQRGLTRASLFSGGFHPNQEGHRQEGKMISPVLKGVLDAGAPPETVDNTTIATVETRPRPGDGGEGARSS